MTSIIKSDESKRKTDLFAITNDSRYLNGNKLCKNQPTAMFTNDQSCLFFFFKDTLYSKNFMELIFINK